MGGGTEIDSGDDRLSEISDQPKSPMQKMSERSDDSDVPLGEFLAGNISASIPKMRKKQKGVRRKPVSIRKRQEDARRGCIVRLKERLEKQRNVSLCPDSMDSSHSSKKQEEEKWLSAQTPRMRMM